MVRCLYYYIQIQYYSLYIRANTYIACFFKAYLSFAYTLSMSCPGPDNQTIGQIFDADSRNPCLLPKF
jgi:hypothetical protein